VLALGGDDGEKDRTPEMESERHRAIPMTMRRMKMNNSHLHARSGIFALKRGQLALLLSYEKASLSCQPLLAIIDTFWVFF
jgi:hypothetical protein